MKLGQSVPKRLHKQFRRRGITQKKEHNILYFFLFYPNILDLMSPDWRRLYILVTFRIRQSLVISGEACKELFMSNASWFSYPGPSKDDAWVLVLRTHQLSSTGLFLLAHTRAGTHRGQWSVNGLPVTANQRDRLCEEQLHCWKERPYALLLCREISSLGPTRHFPKILISLP
jgi:hypothetical protein